MPGRKGVLLIRPSWSWRGYAVWRLTISRLPATWFTAETLPLLDAHCAHVAAARRFKAFLDLFESDWIKVEVGVERLNELSQMWERKTRAATSTAPALRSAHRQSANARSEPRPWNGY